MTKQSMQCYYVQRKKKYLNNAIESLARFISIPISLFTLDALEKLQFVSCTIYSTTNFSRHRNERVILRKKRRKQRKKKKREKNKLLKKNKKAEQGCMGRGMT